MKDKAEGKEISSDIIKDTLKKVKNVANFDYSSEDIKKAGQDWIKCIKSHPMQSLLFGLIGYFVVKRLTK